MNPWLKYLISAGIIVLASEVAKRSTWMAALLVSLPITTILTLIWTHWETHDIEKTLRLSQGIFIFLIPSMLFLPFFIFFLRRGLTFSLGLLFSLLATALSYWVFSLLIKKSNFI
jgi:hypothetical protein